MPKKYIITIKGLQRDTVTETDSDLELITEGEFYSADGVWFCEYDESPLTGLDNAHTLIEIGDNYVSLERSGSVNSQMLFMQNRITSSIYSLKFGSLYVDIHTESLNIDIGEHGGKISIDYIIDINNERNGRNKFDITIREDKTDE